MSTPASVQDTTMWTGLSQAVLSQIEERALILAQQRLEYEQLQVKTGQLASRLASALRQGHQYLISRSLSAGQPNADQHPDSYSESSVPKKSKSSGSYSHHKSPSQQLSSNPSNVFHYTSSLIPQFLTRCLERYPDSTTKATPPCPRALSNRKPATAKHREAFQTITFPLPLNLTSLNHNLSHLHFFPPFSTTPHRVSPEVMAVRRASLPLHNHLNQLAPSSLAFLRRVHHTKPLLLYRW